MAQRLHLNLYSLLFLLSIALRVTIPVVECAPYFMLTNTRPKCFTVEGPRATTFTVLYSVPDMVLLPEDDSSVEKEETPEENNKLHAGLDERFNRRFQDKMRALQRVGKTLTDVSIVVYQKGDTVSSARESSTTIGGGRVREELTTRKGSLEYTTSLTRDAPVEICVQSMAANSKSPERVALEVSRRVKITKEQKEEQERQAQQHISAISGELVQLDRKLEMILANADFSKEQEVEFHEQSLAMNKASQYWPLIHIGVLLITGFTQVRKPLDDAATSFKNFYADISLSLPLLITSRPTI